MFVFTNVSVIDSAPVSSSADDRGARPFGGLRDAVRVAIARPRDAGEVAAPYPGEWKQQLPVRNCMERGRALDDAADAVR